jgi:Asp-tRNA(Asn)/Glu-tRNA(Gln) amidotransferase A subunit family amidase
MSGLHGLATTFGRCPFNYMLDSTVIKSGPIAATSEDVAIAYAVMSQSDPDHFYSKLYDGSVEGLPSPHLSRISIIQDLSDVRIGIFPEWFNDSLPHIRERSYEVISYLKSKGVTFVEINIPHLPQIALAHGFKISNEFALALDAPFHRKSTMYDFYSSFLLLFHFSVSSCFSALDWSQAAVLPLQSDP